MVELIASTSASAVAICRGKIRWTRRVLAWSVCLWTIATTVAFAQCPSPPVTATQQRIERIIDGDTFVLVGGDRVRVLGINTYERNDPERRGAYAKAATQYATQQLQTRVVTLSPYPYRRDRHGRVLAHVWVNDAHLAESLLHEGLGFAVAVPPLTAHAPCLFAAEKRARLAARGIWSEGLAPIAVSALSRGGFAVVEGVVTRVDQRTLWLGAQFAVTLPKGLNIDAGTRIEVRGWIRGPKAGDAPAVFRLPLADPANLQRSVD